MKKAMQQAFCSLNLHGLHDLHGKLTALGSKNRALMSYAIGDNGSRCRVPNKSFKVQKRVASIIIGSPDRLNLSESFT